MTPEAKRKLEETFDRDTLQMSLLSAGITPGDLSKIMPCHPATMYAFFKNGGGRAMTLFLYKRIYRFLTQGVEDGALPNPTWKNSAQRQEGIKKLYNSWALNEETFKETA